MKYTGTTYRPPIEDDSLLVQVTRGCAHNSCSFCTMYKDIPFGIESMEQIERDLMEAREKHDKVDRVFLVNGDAFVLSFNKLKAISEKIIHYFPEVESISMYASVDNIKNKTDLELSRLRELRINDLYIGLETGSPEGLKILNKGHSLEDALKELKRLNKYDIDHIALLMLGSAGSHKALETARYTARLLNETRPKIIWIGSLGLYPGSLLSQSWKEGDFQAPREYDMLMEEKELLRLLDYDPYIYGIHPSNLAAIEGQLSLKREQMIYEIDDLVEDLGLDFLNSYIDRGSAL